MKYTSSERGTRPIVIGGISACGGDRLDALLATISGSIQDDAVCGDYLAELNLAWLSSQLADDPSKGYEQSIINVGRLSINLDTKTVRMNDAPLHLTKRSTEFWSF